MLQQICVFMGGILMIALGVFHVRFYSIFQWEKEFKKLSSGNQKILYTIHLALTILFSLVGMISILFYRELSASRGLALGINLSLVLFGCWRTVWQLVYFRGKLNPRRILLIGWFMVLTISYMIPVFVRFGVIFK